MNRNDDALVQAIGAVLRERHWRLVTAESCTGGGVAAALTSVAGSSDWFDGGFVTYSNALKMALLGVDATVLQQQGAVSAAAVQAMASGALQRTGAQLALAVSGIAGPGGGTVEKPVGLVWFAWAGAEGPVRCSAGQFAGDRAAVRAQAVTRALEGVLQYMGGEA